MSLLLLAALQDPAIRFERVALSEDFTCEGATFADLDRDGDEEVVAGPWWWEGPDWKVRHAIYEPKAFDPKGYSDSFFDWTRDLDGDGWLDLVVVGFPGKEAFGYRNPLADPAMRDARWERSLVFGVVDNEAPAFADLTGDGAPELVFHTGGRFGWAEPKAGDPKAPWVFHAISENLNVGAFTHGLGVGDVDGDGRKDVLWKEGWFQQPASLAGDPEWQLHPFPFSDREGGAQMFAFDVDADGDGDVITSLAAHHFGLSWFEQVKTEGRIDFVEHRIMDDEPSDSPHGVRFAELHALDLADVDGDGLLDIITGKRWWSHGAQGDPEPGSKPVVYWFQLVRGADGKVEYVPHLADDGSGVGTQLVTGDVDRDGLRDIVIGNKRGAFVLFQRTGPAEPVRPGEPQKDEVAGPPTLDFESGDLRGWTATGNAFEGQPIRGDAPAARKREASRHQGEFWIGGYEKHGDDRKGTLTSAPFAVSQPWASFLVGGGPWTSTRVEVVLAAGDRVLFRTCGASYESLQRVAVDLSAHLGEEIRLRIVDEATGHWGHVNFDDFRFHDSKPAIERPAGAPAILPMDEVANAGLSPQAAQAAMTVPPGFRVDLVAAEPDVHQPIAMAIDDRGRLWVAEAFTYPARAKEGEGQDDILVFEDADGDGRFEKRTVFMEGLNLVSGLEVGFGGVWIGAAPNLLFVPDRDGDLVPDGPAEVLLDGFGYEDTHETLNAFNWGPDGWLYGCHGVFTHSKVGPPGAPDAQRTPLNAGVWRFHPTRREFEVFAWGTSNPWGVDWDARGQCFITACVIPHLWHVIQGARYERQAGSHFDPFVFEDIHTIADHLHYLGDSPHGGNLRSNEAGGGHAHCGALVYLGGAFPEEWNGAVLMSNIHGNRLNADLLERSGSGFVGKHGVDLLRANDRWFRGVALRSGPDGAVYATDWYDKQACHLTDPQVWDRTNGRIWRVSYGPERPRKVDLGKLPSAELVGLQLHENEWFVRHARRILQERGPDPKVHAALKAMMGREEDGGRRLRALWALHVTGGLGPELAHLLRDAQGHVQAWAIQLLLERRDATPEAIAEMERLAARTQSPLVRLYLASGLQRLPLESRWRIAERLLARAEDAQDKNIPLQVWNGIEPLVAADPERALALLRACRIEKVSRFVVRRAACEPKLHEALVRALADHANASRLPWMLAEAATGLADQRKLAEPRGWADLYARLARSADAEVRDGARRVAVAFGARALLPDLRRTVADASASSDARTQALKDLVRFEDAEALPVLLDLLDDREVRGAVLRALSAFDDPRIASAVLARYASLTTEEQRDALNTLTSRVPWASRLLDAVGSGAVPRGDLGAFVVRKIEGLRDERLAARVAEVWGRVRASPEATAKRIAGLKTLADAALPALDLARGREVFSRTCEQCHTLFAAGGKVGPDLTGSNRADLDYLLSNVVDPNAVVGKDYLATLVWLKDGRLVTGIRTGSTDSSMTLRTENESIVVANEDVEESRLSDLSTMPEGLLDALKESEIRDLIGYLRGPAQVPLLATKANVERFFDGRSLAGWSGDPACWSVEEGEVVGRTSGLAKNEFLKSDLELADFRLTLEVRLVADQGNSGIQFRSRALEDGDVAGLQADIGPGWWGKLYDEHGRGLLSDRSGDEHVAKDGWNRYEIEARGTRVRTWINGKPCVDLGDPLGATRGIVALQIHSGGPTEVRFRKLRLEFLD